jgi:hypothetical protein
MTPTREEGTRSRRSRAIARAPPLADEHRLRREALPGFQAIDQPIVNQLSDGLRATAMCPAVHEQLPKGAVLVSVT